MNRANSNPSNHAIGLTTKKVVVERIEGNVAICRDTTGYRSHVRMDVQRAKGAAPEVGEHWMLSNDLGQWSFAAILDNNPTGGLILKDTVTGTRYLVHITNGVIVLSAVP